jgi:predicted heme/steroid binding protein
MLYNGEDPKKPIYLALNGTIYDVSAGKTTYGPGGSYHHFAGRDAARAFITGCFAEDLTADLRGVEIMYIPKDDPKIDSQIPKRDLKIRREQEKRAAKKQVQDTIEGWAKVFRGETGRPYYPVGQLQREPDWMDKNPPHPLCEAAEESRQKRTLDKNDKTTA